MEYSKINASQHKNDIFGIWNIPGIFQKNTITIKIGDFLEYGMEYSERITTHGGVKFNQAGKGVDREKPQVERVLTHCFYVCLNHTTQGL